MPEHAQRLIDMCSYTEDFDPSLVTDILRHEHSDPLSVDETHQLADLIEGMWDRIEFLERTMKH